MADTDRGGADGLARGDLDVAHHDAVGVAGQKGEGQEEHGTSRMKERVMLPTPAPGIPSTEAR